MLSSSLLDTQWSVFKDLQVCHVSSPKQFIRTKANKDPQVIPVPSARHGVAMENHQFQQVFLASLPMPEGQFGCFPSRKTAAWLKPWDPTSPTRHPCWRSSLATPVVWSPGEIREYQQEAVWNYKEQPKFSCSYGSNHLEYHGISGAGS